MSEEMFGQINKMLTEHQETLVEIIKTTRKALELIDEDRQRLESIELRLSALEPRFAVDSTDSERQGLSPTAAEAKDVPK